MPLSSLARFRIKKKQREAALEASAKELSARVRELEGEIARLRTENGWLKGLITVRPGQGPPGTLPATAATATSDQTQTDTHVERHTGIVPRGVGTDAANGGDPANLQRDREEVL